LIAIHSKRMSQVTLIEPEHRRGYISHTNIETELTYTRIYSIVEKYLSENEVVVEWFDRFTFEWSVTKHLSEGGVMDARIRVWSSSSSSSSYIIEVNRQEGPHIEFNELFEGLKSEIEESSQIG